MASEQEIAEGLEALFRETNPNSFNSLNEVVLRLQSNLGFDLSNKIDFIRAQITLIFCPPPPPQPPQQHLLPSSPPPSAAVAPPPPVVVSRPVSSPVNPNPNLNVDVPHHRSAGVNVPRHHPSSGSVSHHHPNAGSVPHHPHRQHVFQTQSHFPRGPTEISFAQPGGGAVVTDSLSSPPSKDSGQKPKRRGGPGGLNKLCGVSPQLQAIVGQPAMPRTEIVKQLWAYIRKNNLQDPSNKRKIICNDELRLVFEVDCTDMFQMNKLLSKHILPLDPTKDSGQQSKKLKVEESPVPSSEPAALPAAMPTVMPAAMPSAMPAAMPSAMPAAMPSAMPAAIPAALPAPFIVISEALANFFGTSEKEMLQSDVYKRIEEYIKTEGLEDPLNSMVICDTKLQELLGCETITASAIRDALARNHLFQQA